MQSERKETSIEAAAAKILFEAKVSLPPKAKMLLDQIGGLSVEQYKINREIDKLAREIDKLATKQENLKDKYFAIIHDVFKTEVDGDAATDMLVKAMNRTK